MNAFLFTTARLEAFCSVAVEAQAHGHGRRGDSSRRRQGTGSSRASYSVRISVIAEGAERCRRGPATPPLQRVRALRYLVLCFKPTARRRHLRFARHWPLINVIAAAIERLDALPNPD
ncbi:hypothetical protein ACFRFL_40155 [Streptomyces sp. NPDC056708]|uniref:hypothetical protein n=1 Tax=unclassified Streptomyces TaxID=2593676 RepID=UPI0036833A75